MKQTHIFSGRMFRRFTAVIMAAVILLTGLPVFEAVDTISGSSYVTYLTPAQVSAYAAKTDYCDGGRDISEAAIEALLKDRNSLLSDESVWKYSGKVQMDSLGVAQREFGMDVSDWSPAKIIKWCCDYHRCDPALVLTILQYEMFLVEGTRNNMKEAVWTDHFNRAAGFLQADYYSFFGQVIGAAWRYRQYQKAGTAFEKAYRGYTWNTDPNGFSVFVNIYYSYAKTLEDKEAALKQQDPPPVGPPVTPVDPLPPAEDANYDLNADGKVNNLDVMVLMKLIYAEEKDDHADLNADGKVNNMDVLALMKRVNEVQEDAA